MSIEKKDGKVTYIEYIIIMSDKAVVEEYRPNAEGTWDIVVSAYSTNAGKATEEVQKLMFTHRFKNTEADSARRVLQKIGFQDVDWSGSPHRLISYFEKNAGDFEQLQEK